MSNDDIEIKSAERTIELLKQYKSATTQEQRDILLKQMDILMKENGMKINRMEKELKLIRMVQFMKENF